MFCHNFGQVSDKEAYLHKDFNTLNKVIESSNFGVNSFLPLILPAINVRLIGEYDLNSRQKRVDIIPQKVIWHWKQSYTSIHQCKVYFD